MLIFGEKSVRWSQTPSPLAYAVYAFINVDNCERPLTNIIVTSMRKRCSTTHADNTSLFIYKRVVFTEHIDNSCCKIQPPCYY